MDFLQRTENFLRYLVMLFEECLVILPLYVDLLRHHSPRC
jgi:hypothetical protein